MTAFDSSIEHRQLSVTERIQAGDVFLLKYLCPLCHEENLQSYPLDKTSCCSFDISNKILIIKSKRLLVGTFRSRKHVTKKVIRSILEMQGYNCGYCFIDIKLIQYHVDHIIPLCVGGTNNIENLCLSCPKCNLIAGGKVFNSFAAKKNYILNKRKINN